MFLMSHGERTRKPLARTTKPSRRPCLLGTAANSAKAPAGRAMAAEYLTPPANPARAPARTASRIRKDESTRTTSPTSAKPKSAAHQSTYAQPEAAARDGPASSANTEAHPAGLPNSEASAMTPAQVNSAAANP